jgi:hypothetical protein
MWLYLVGGALALIAGTAAVESSGKKPKKSKADGPTKHLSAPRLPLTTAPIQPAGIPQPAGYVSLPAPPPTTTSLQSAAQNLVTYLARTTPGKASVPAVQAFQTAYNMSGPSTTLKSDGIYGPKTQAALQSVMGGAPAPAHFVPSGAVAAPPLIPAAKPIAGVSVTGAAQVLANLTSIPKTSDSRVSTFQNAYNQYAAVHVIADGKYGGATQGALQSVLDFMGTGGQAPKNPFGLAVVRPKAAFSMGGSTSATAYFDASQSSDTFTPTTDMPPVDPFIPPTGSV